MKLLHFKLRTFFIALSIIASFTLSAQTKDVKPKSNQAKQSSKVSRTALIQFAKQYLGTPYIYASANPSKGFDCSGFVYYIFNNFDIVVPRSSQGFKSVQTTIQPKDFQIGDVLVFYGYKDNTVVGHLGIICEANGMKSKFIHSSSGKAMGVTISDLNSEMYTRRFYKCVSVLQ
jgi:cell wall-associated NlpC family hydrolase